jgi:hypothetical protein
VRPAAAEGDRESVGEKDADIDVGQVGGHHQGRHAKARALGETRLAERGARQGVANIIH